MSREQVVEIVNRYLQAKPSQSGFTLHATSKGAREDGSWWYIPVYPGGAEPRTFECYTILSEVESEIREDEHFDLLLVPTSAPAEKVAV